MKKRSLGLISILVLIVAGMLLFAGCGNTTSTTKDESASDAVETATVDLKDDITNDYNDLKTELDNISKEAETATGADAAALKDRTDYLVKRIDDTTASLDKMVSDGTITEDVKDETEKDLASIKDEAVKLGDELSGKTDGAAATEDDMAVGSAKDLKDEDSIKTALDKVGERVTSLTDKVGDDLSKDSKGTIDYLKLKVDEYEDYLTKVGKRIDQLVSENVITEDVKKGYDDTISTIKTDLDGLKVDLDKTAE